jgi:hypothetical protein
MNANDLYAGGEMERSAALARTSAPLVLEIAQKQTERPWTSLSDKQKLIVLLGIMATLRGAPASPDFLLCYSEALSKEKFEDAVKALEYFSRQPRGEHESGVPSLGLLLDRIHKRGTFVVIRNVQIRTLEDLRRDNNAL